MTDLWQLLQIGGEIRYQPGVETWLFNHTQTQQGDMITVEILREAIERGSLQASRVDGVVMLELTEQGKAELESHG